MLYSPKLHLPRVNSTNLSGGQLFGLETTYQVTHTPLPAFPPLPQVPGTWLGRHRAVFPCATPGHVGAAGVASAALVQPWCAARLDRSHASGSSCTHLVRPKMVHRNTTCHCINNAHTPTRPWLRKPAASGSLLSARPPLPVGRTTPEL